MNINQAAHLVSEKECLKKQVNIAQIKEILKVLNEITNKELYKILRKI